MRSNVKLVIRPMIVAISMVFSPKGIANKITSRKRAVTAANPPRRGAGLHSKS